MTDKEVAKAVRHIMDETANQIEKAQTGNWNLASPIAYELFLTGTIEDVAKAQKLATLKDLIQFAIDRHYAPEDKAWLKRIVADFKEAKIKEAEGGVER